MGLAEGVDEALSVLAEPVVPPVVAVLAAHGVPHGDEGGVATFDPATHEFTAGGDRIVEDVEERAAVRRKAVAVSDDS